jgi:hypothetical protein
VSTALAEAGWWHNPRSRRWEYRDNIAGPVMCWFAVAWLETTDLSWAEVRARTAERSGGVPIPDEARPSEQARAAWDDGRGASRGTG